MHKVIQEKLELEEQVAREETEGNQENLESLEKGVRLDLTGQPEVLEPLEKGDWVVTAEAPDRMVRLDLLDRLEQEEDLEKPESQGTVETRVVPGFQDLKAVGVLLEVLVPMGKKEDQVHRDLQEKMVSQVILVHSASKVYQEYREHLERKEETGR